MSGRWVSHTANLWKYDLAVYICGWLASYGQSRRMFPCLLPEFTYSNTSEELTTLSRTNLVMVSMCNFPPILAHNCPVHYTTQDQWPGRFLGIIGWDPSVCRSNRLHVDDILRFSFIELGYILWIPLKWLVVLVQSWWTSTGYFSTQLVHL